MKRDEVDAVIQRSGFRLEGFAERYDAARPRPPEALLDLLCRLAAVGRPRLVVDLGSGTGLSTNIWSGRSSEAVGVEPNPDMRAQAVPLPGVRFVDGLSSDTGLPDECADIVTVSQALHWMEPEPTFAEVARILRPGGVFAAYDNDWPPTVHPEIDAAFDAVLDRVDGLREWRPGREAKVTHLKRMKACGRFRYVRETLVHGIELGGADRIVDLVKSQGVVARMLDGGMAEEELGLTELRAAAERVLGTREAPMLFSYRVRLGFL